MSRYFYYLFTLGMLINTIFFVPRILIGERFDGAVVALILAILLGTLFATLFTKAMNRFPGEGIPEIFKRSLPGFIRVPFLLFLGTMWALAGSIILIAFSGITVRFLSPETDPTLLLLCYCGFGCWAASFRPKAVLHLAEIVIVLNIPFVVYIMYKSVASRYMNWDDVKVLSDYALKMPSWRALAAATYPFTGYIHLALYNRLYKRMKIRHLWLIPVIGTFVLMISFIVPIGLLGVDAAGDYLYVWITATDALRMEFGFIERVSFLFLFIYIGFSLLFVTVTWNVGAILIEDTISVRDIKLKKYKIPVRWLVIGGIGLVTLIFGVLADDKSLIRFVNHWQSLRLAIEILLVAVVVWLGWRQKKHA